MAIAALTSRFATYYSRHGLRGTAQRAGTALKRALFFNRQVVFYCDLASQASPQEPLPSLLKVEKKSGFDELSSQELHELIEFWNPKLARYRIQERFANGASLWFVKSREKLAGYGWTLRGGSIESHYFPFGQDDVHFFDFHVFPQYRGRGMNRLLVGHILRSLAADGQGRAFIEAAEWNQPQLSSLGRTPFRQVGCARKWTIFRRTVVWWTGNLAVKQLAANGRESLSPQRREADTVRKIG
jgi:ribosomal protein S18 acetylase RimI-like enzyme